MSSISRAMLVSAKNEAETLLRQFKMVFGSPMSATNMGLFLSRGSGSSLDFEEHRAYFPGDDPRHINWQAYAKTDSYLMKSFRPEVSPKVDLYLDVTRSMFLNSAKTRRTLELMYFIILTSKESLCSLRCSFFSGSELKQVPIEQILACELPEDTFSLRDEVSEEVALAIKNLPGRQGARGFVISDLLFEIDPSDVIHSLNSHRRELVIICPFSEAEANPDWDGHMKLLDCEKGVERKVFVGKQLVEDYLESYERHFKLWKDVCRSEAIPFVRVASEIELGQALRAEAFSERVLEAWN